MLHEGEDSYGLLKHDLERLVSKAVRNILQELRLDKEQTDEQLWCNSRRAREILGVRKTKLQDLRDKSPDNGIVISKHGNTIRYYIPSLYEYLEKHIIK